MARWASYIDNQRAESSVLLLDTGNFCRARKVKTDKLDYRYFFEAMKKMDYAAVNIADNEIRFGRRKLLETAEKYDIPLISSNIYDKRGQQTLGSKYIIKNVGGKTTLFGRKGGLRVGIFSVVLPHFIYDVDPIVPKYYDVKNPNIAALEAVSKLREEGCDLIIAISHQGWLQSLSLADEIDGIDIVVNGRKNHSGTYHEWFDSTIVVDTGNKRMSLTEIEIEYRNGKRYILATDMGARAHKSPERTDLKKLEDIYTEELEKAGIDDARKNN
ncbi:MAG: hypothetical protein KAV42_04180 [Candidatus Krumholzibacteria bacterium]|nr:hypothetical protein [Candidatus Krumholzibacteria bacterium]